MSPAEQLIVNRYRLLETSGSGAYGTVDLAWDTRLQRRVAIKRIPLSPNVNETNLPGIQEARTAALLNDAHIVTLLDFQVTGTQALIIMEYVDGPTLGNLLKESPQLLDLDIITTIISDVAAALECAHENQVLHLDIKPDNILIDHQGNVKVSDFGLSQLSGIAGFSEPQGGTLGYMPPEQLRQQEVDARTDLWALASLAYQLLTGQNPFYAPTLQGSLNKILNQPLPLPTSYRPDLDPYADELIVKALMADKTLRFDSVSQFISQISPFLGNVKKGRKELKYRINIRDLDELELSDAWHQEDLPPAYEEAYDEQPQPTPLKPPLWQGLPQRLRGALGRLVAAVACGSFAAVGLSGFGLLEPGALAGQVTGQLQLILLVGIIALIALGAFIAPRLGSALASVVFIAGFFARGLILVGILVALLLIAWWLFSGRKGTAQSALVMLTPLLGALSLGFALPLLAGYFLSPKKGIIPAAVQGLLLLVMASVTGSSTLARTSLIIPNQSSALSPTFSGALSTTYTPFTWFPRTMVDFLSGPLPWIMLAAFILAFLISSALATRQTRWSALVGSFLASVLLMLGCLSPLLIPSLTVNPVDLTLDGIGLSLSFILLVLLSLLGVFTQPEQGSAN